LTAPPITCTGLPPPATRPAPRAIISAVNADRSEEFRPGDEVVLGTIGRGGMGEVCLADDLMLDRKVALKVLAPHLSDDVTFFRHTGPELPEEEAAQLTALGRQLPVVVIGRRVAGGGVDVVRTADAEGVGQVVDHLAGLGHRSIAYVDGGRGTIAADRRRGYRTAMRRHGLAGHVRVLPGDHTEAAGTRAARALLAGGALPTAVVAYNDSCALGLLDAFNRAGVEVPADVSVAGYDDSSLARLAHVNLTTVSQDARGQAEHAVAAAVERLDGGRVRPREVVLAPRLVVRGTTGPPPAAGEYPGRRTSRAGRARAPDRGTGR
jgi:hypothetical protein